MKATLMTGEHVVAVARATVSFEIISTGDKVYLLHNDENLDALKIVHTMHDEAGTEPEIIEVQP